MFIRVIIGRCVASDFLYFLLVLFGWRKIIFDYKLSYIDSLVFAKQMGYLCLRMHEQRLLLIQVQHQVEITLFTCKLLLNIVCMIRYYYSTPLVVMCVGIKN